MGWPERAASVELVDGWVLDEGWFRGTPALLFYLFDSSDCATYSTALCVVFRKLYQSVALINAIREFVVYFLCFPYPQSTLSTTKANRKEKKKK